MRSPEKKEIQKGTKKSNKIKTSGITIKQFAIQNRQNNKKPEDDDRKSLQRRRNSLSFTIKLVLKDFIVNIEKKFEAFVNKLIDRHSNAACYILTSGSSHAQQQEQQEKTLLQYYLTNSR